MSSGKALVSSERAIPRRPLRVPRAILSLRDVLATRRTGCRCLPVGSFPRRNESRGDSLQKPACQPPFFFLSQQRYGNRGELEACQSSSPLIPPVQTNHRGFALSFPRLLSLLGLAGVSLLSLKLPFSNHPGTSSRLGYLWNAEGYFCLRLVEQTRGGGWRDGTVPPGGTHSGSRAGACCRGWGRATWYLGITPGALPS